MSSNVDDLLYGFTRNATADEIHQLRSVTQSLQHDLISDTVSQRFKARLKMLVSETCVSAIALQSTQNLHPHVASIFHHNILGTMQSS